MPTQILLKQTAATSLCYASLQHATFGRMLMGRFAQTVGAAASLPLVIQLLTLATFNSVPDSVFCQAQNAQPLQAKVREVREIKLNHFTTESGGRGMLATCQLKIRNLSRPNRDDTLGQLASFCVAWYFSLDGRRFHKIQLLNWRMVEDVLLV